MVKVYDPQKKIRETQNFIILTGLYGGIILAIYYLYSLLTIFVIEGLNQIVTLFSINALQHFVVVAKTVVYYFNLFIQNFYKIGITDYNFFIPKVITLLVIFPITTVGILAFIFRDKIRDFTPIKKDTSVHHTLRSWRRR